jgi:riboflavin kinase/FMN adenylyltransferase
MESRYNSTLCDAAFFMRVTHGHSLAGLPPVALTIGNFDGVHKGHQAMLARVMRQAQAQELQSCVLTFEPHPREFFERLRERSSNRSAPRQAPTRLTSLREKLELIASFGMERTHIERFSGRFAALEPKAFVEQVLVKTLRARWVLVGHDFRFGAKPAGDNALLCDLGAAAGFELEVMDPVMHEGVRVSSVAVRQALAQGELARSEALLGRPYSISGRVVHGDKLGRELGFSTANIQMKHNRPPLTGIFAVRLHGVGFEPLSGVASLGVRPTVKSGGGVVLEVHLFDFSGELYGRHVRVDFLHKLREEEKFPDLETLRSQIARDCEAARAYHREHRKA